MRRSPIALASIVLAIPSLAAAQSAAPGAVPVAAVPAAPVAPIGAPTEPATPPLVGLARRVADDAAADRAYAAPTALIAPSGTTTVTVRAPVGPLVAGNLTFALSDRVELGVGTVLVADEDGGVLSLHGKLQLWRSARAALAASLDLYRVEDGREDAQLLVPALVASVCAGGDDCRTLVSAHLTAALARGEDEMPVLPGLSIVSGGRTKLVLEGHLYQDSYDGDRALFGYGGVRWTSGKLALDGGIGLFAQPEADVCYDDGSCSGDDPELLPWPFVGLSARL